MLCSWDLRAIQGGASGVELPADEMDQPTVEAQAGEGPGEVTGLAEGDQGQDPEVSEAFEIAVDSFAKFTQAASVTQLEFVVDTMSFGEQDQQVRAYLNFVKTNESLRVCSRCRYSSGCDFCCYDKALSFVMRHQRPGSWWHRQAGKALRAVKQAKV